jgi:CO dehydrogenase/acetyl-CoA synthase beta subunit
MGKIMTCPCGQPLMARTDDQFVSIVDAHLQEMHQGRTYPGEMILMMATSYPDDEIPE